MDLSVQAQLTSFEAQIDTVETGYDLDLLWHHKRFLVYYSFTMLSCTCLHSIISLTRASSSARSIRREVATLQGPLPQTESAVYVRPIRWALGGVNSPWSEAGGRGVTQPRAQFTDHAYL